MSIRNKLLKEILAKMKPATKLTTNDTTDESLYTINPIDGLVDIGLTTTLTIEDPAKEDVQVFIDLPYVAGSTGSSSINIHFVKDPGGANTILKSSGEFKVGNNPILNMSATLIATRPLDSSGTGTFGVMVESISGEITIDNNGPANDEAAEAIAFQFKDTF